MAGADSSPLPRFVAQHHVRGDDSHWDLMFEHGQALATWRAPCPLSQIRDQPVSLTRIGDHRLAYLTYEGPLSRDRGRVSIEERGVFRVRSWGAAACVLELEGEQTAGVLRIQREHASGDRWHAVLEHRSPVD